MNAECDAILSLRSDLLLLRKTMNENKFKEKRKELSPEKWHHNEEEYLLLCVYIHTKKHLISEHETWRLKVLLQFTYTS